MNSVRAVIGVGIVALVLFAWGQYRQIGLQRELIKKQEGAIAAVVSNLDTVKGLAENAREQMAGLLTAQSNISGVLTARQQEIRRLQDDVEEIRTWASVPLPADIARMRQHPAAHGAADYGKSMLPGSSVRAASSVSSK